jgi:hypothetical protein
MDHASKPERLPNLLITFSSRLIEKSDPEAPCNPPLPPGARVDTPALIFAWNFTILRKAASVR